ncbi:MAG: hydroxylamine reductase, partial [Romboutsia sp.]
MEEKMFCFQCQETAGCTGCTKFGVCGKSPDLARMQDLLIYVTKGLSEVTTKLRNEKKVVSNNVNNLITINLFTTITNANFDDEVFYDRVKDTLNIKEELLARLTNKENLSEAALWNVYSKADMDEKSNKVGVLATKDEDIRSLRELIIYGLKGLSAYMKHANSLGFDNEEVNIFIQNTLAKTLNDKLIIEELIDLTLETGKVGVDGMSLLDSANTGTYGHPEVTKVNIGVGTNPGILVSGHDLKDLELLLKQTEGMAIDVYTHSEMLPAHYYPKFKKYTNFVGNYGNAWWKQKEEFESFNG